MIIARSLKEIEHDPDTTITVGTFDGVHRGHQSIIRHLEEHARTTLTRSIIVTFEPHPREVVGKGPVMLLSTLDERLSLISRFDIDAILVLDFTYDFSQQTPREFYENYILRGIGMSEVIVGHDHMFGRDRRSDIRELQKMGVEYSFGVVVVPPVSEEGEIISSTKIRNILSAGQVERAAKFLNRPYTVEGTVVTGDGRGTALGFPTANIMLKSENKLISGDGVYFVSINLGGIMYCGMVNIGWRPTFEIEHRRSIEVNIFDMNHVVYGEELTVRFLRRIREEVKFTSKEELITQLHADRNLCLQLKNEMVLTDAVHKEK